MSPDSGRNSEFGVIESKPGMPDGVNPVAGSWSACAMLSMIERRSIASAIARRWFTSGMFFVLTP